MIYFLVLYFVLLTGFIIYSAAGIYHLWRFGYVGDLTKPAIFIYIILVSLVIIASLILIFAQSWPATFNF